MSGTKFQTVGAETDRLGRAVNDAAASAGAALRDTAADLNQRVGRQADEAVQELSRRVEAQPITALLVAGGIGLLAGMLLARR
ncbi:MAG TPA: hypothetical protein VMB71_07595 [Acetobacteraceae bacterium]|nr:hypothetical protein [Acetobacteraceae bacterium]